MTHDHHHHHNGAGHNHAPRPGKTVQWQTPHRPDAGHHHDDHEHDLDLVEAAFVEGFASASDPTSFIRLAQIPFEATDKDGTKLVLLRVETDAVTDLGAVMPHLGGTSFRYDPLPARMASRRRRLRFVYFDGQGPRALDLAAVRELVAA